jgi:carbamoyl-phosphate synthase large subunit
MSKKRASTAGDSACILPPYSIPTTTCSLEITAATQGHGRRSLNVVGLMNVQYAIKDQQVFVLEVNPRASRTIPFVSKATGVPLAKLATKVMLGRNTGRTGAHPPK